MSVCKITVFFQAIVAAAVLLFSQAFPAVNLVSAAGSAPAEIYAPEGVYAEALNDAATAGDDYEGGAAIPAESRSFTKRLISIVLGTAGLAAVFVLFAALMKRRPASKENAAADEPPEDRGVADVTVYDRGDGVPAIAGEDAGPVSGDPDFDALALNPAVEDETIDDALNAMPGTNADPKAG